MIVIFLLITGILFALSLVSDLVTVDARKKKLPVHVSCRRAGPLLFYHKLLDPTPSNLMMYFYANQR